MLRPQSLFLCLFTSGLACFLVYGAPQRQADTDGPADRSGSHSSHPEPSTRKAIHHEFGIVYVGEPITHTFVVKNESKTPLRFQGVRTTCGCTTTGNIPRVIDPGQQGNLEVTFKPGSKEGVIRKSTFLDIVGGGVVELSFSATVRPRTRILPNRIDERCVTGSGEREYSAVVENWTANVWDQFSVTSTVDWLECDAVPIPVSEPTLQPVESWRLIIKIIRPPAVGHHRGSVHGATSDGETLFDFPVFVTVTHPVRAVPDRLFFGEVNVRSQSRASLKILVDAEEIPGSKSLELTLMSRSEALKCDLKRKTDRYWEVDCVFAAGSDVGLFKSSLLISVPALPSLQLEIPVVAAVIDGAGEK
ncbi:MAG: DUF1573 domain-containing protein [Planctomycetaceae bacterium]